LSDHVGAVVPRRPVYRREHGFQRRHSSHAAASRFFELAGDLPPGLTLDGAPAKYVVSANFASPANDRSSNTAQVGVITAAGELPPRPSWMLAITLIDAPGAM
jgi:hypothetical protein